MAREERRNDTTCASKLKPERTQTVMQGATHRDFNYTHQQ